jgi:SAM-dependent methyltransferase
MEDYREEFYRLYRTTHVEPRKGEATLKSHVRRYSKWDRLIGPFLPPSRDADVVDCGCGNGQIVSWLRERGYTKALGVDGSPEEVDAALKLGLPIQLGDFRDFLRARPGGLDFIILRNVIEHFYKAEIVDLLRVAKHSLREGGKVFLQVPNAETPFGARLRYADFTHEIAFTTSSISQVLRVCGYSDIQVGPIRPAFRGWQRFLWKTVEWVYRTMLYAELRQKDFVLTQDLYAVASARAIPQAAKE